MRYWTFEPNLCRFERSPRIAALGNDGTAVVNDGMDVYIIRDKEPATRWSSGEPLVVAGVEFERELFE